LRILFSDKINCVDRGGVALVDCDGGRWGDSARGPCGVGLACPDLGPIGPI
jgi:hypothetical protein